MKKLLAIVVLGLLLSGCKSWHEVTQIVDKRDTRTNFYNGDFNRIYVGVGSDKEEKLKAYQFENSLFCKNQPSCASKEMIAQQQCIEHFKFSQPIFKKMIVFSKEDIKKHRLGYKKYAQYYCEPK